MLTDFTEEQLEIEQEHHPCASLLKRFIEWKNLELNIEDGGVATSVVYFSGKGGNLCIASKISTKLIPFVFYFGSSNEDNSKDKLLDSEFLCAQILCDMAGKHFFMFKNDHSSEFMHDFDFPLTWQELEMQMTIAGF